MVCCSDFPDTKMPGMIHKQSSGTVCSASMCIISSQEVKVGETCYEQAGQAESSTLSQQLMVDTGVMPVKMRS